MPEHVKDGQFGKWLENARDWSITRNRFWGSPDPGVEVRRPGTTRGSTSTARSRSSSATSGCDGHRPAPAVRRRADPAEPRRPDRAARRCAASRTCSTCGSTPGRCRSPRCTTRSRTHDWFEHHFPGDFIVEYIGQTRGWFYTLHILATALFDRPAFATCVSHGIVLGSDGQKMSKSLRNYPDVCEVFDRDGADAMRWFLMSLADPARRQPHRHRAGHPRRRAPGDDPAVERLVLLPALRQRGSRRRGLRARSGRPTRPTCSTATCWPSCASSSTTMQSTRWTPTRSPTPATRCAPSSTCSPTGTSGARATGSGAARTSPRRGVRHALHGARDGCRVVAPAAAAHHRGDLARAHRRAVGAPRPTGRSRRPARRTTRSSRRWTGSARSARRSPRCARPTSCGSGCRWRR